MVVIASSNATPRNLGYYGIKSDDKSELTVGWSDVSIAFCPADLDQRGQDVVDALGGVIRGIDDYTREDGSSLHNLHVEICEVILMNDGVPASWSAVPSDLSVVCLFEQRAEYRTGSSIEQRGSDDDSL